MKTLLLALLLSVSSHASGPSAAVTPGGWESLSTLQTGNMRFYEGHPVHPNQDPARRELVSGGQKPHTIIISCSDSRVAPETIFDQGLGDIFTVRNAGNVVSPEVIASVEYAVEHLGSKLILVMGHESCGAVGAAVASKAGVSNGSESLDTLVRQVRGNLTSASVTAAGIDKTFRQSVKENVTANLRSLVQRSEIVREAVEKKGVVLGQAIYSLKSGRVEFWDVGRPVDASSVPAPLVKEQKVVEEVISDMPRPAATKKKSH
jgi:carbonic anhydrase